MCSAECDLLAKVDAWWLALSSAAPPDTPLSAQVTTALKASRALAVRLRKLADAAEGGLRLRFLSLELLGRHLQLQLLQRPAEAVERLEEVKACVDEMTGEGAAGAREEGKPAVVEVVIDLLLSMMEQVRAGLGGRAGARVRARLGGRAGARIRVRRRPATLGLGLSP